MKKITITPQQAERVRDNLRLMLTFIDANIPPERTEPNREGRMLGARQVLCENRKDIGDELFFLMALFDFVRQNYSGPANVIGDAAAVLFELGILTEQREPVA